MALEAKFDTIREDIRSRYPELSALVDRRFPHDSRGPDAFKYALELYLRKLPNLEAAVDGFTHLNVVEETPEVLRVVGISLVLPSSKVPIDAEFRRIGSRIEYRILVGADDEVWNAQTESKQWKSVYCFATQDVEPSWNWKHLVEGSLDG